MGRCGAHSHFGRIIFDVVLDLTEKMNHFRMSMLWHDIHLSDMGQESLQPGFIYSVKITV